MNYVYKSVNMRIQGFEIITYQISTHIPILGFPKYTSINMRVYVPLPFYFGIYVHVYNQASVMVSYKISLVLSEYFFFCGTVKDSLQFQITSFVHVR